MSSNQLPLFPLSSVVLFPHIRAPFYIFETRYRQMVRNALEGERRIGMVAVVPDAADDLSGNPPVFEVGCEGSISAAQQRDDGTWNIVLSGTNCFRIVTESPPTGKRLYRTATVTRIQESTEPGLLHGVSEQRKVVVRVLSELLEEVAVAMPEDSVENSWRASLQQLEAIEDERFISVAAQSIDFGVLEKQRLLETNGTSMRFQVLEDLLRFRIAELRTRAGSGSDRIQ